MNHNFSYNYYSPNDGALLDDYRAMFVFLERVLARFANHGGGSYAKRLTGSVSPKSTRGRIWGPPRRPFSRLCQCDNALCHRSMRRRVLHPADPHLLNHDAPRTTSLPLL